LEQAAEEKVMTTLTIDTKAFGPAWNSLQAVFPVKIRPIRDEEHHEQMVAVMNALLDVVGDNEGHELADLLDLVGQLVEDYEASRYTLPKAAPHEVLRFLMDRHGLNQADVAKEVGGQPVVSDILNDKRAINARQAKALAARFGVSAGVFL
jgi:HTH-type transcriptional regulator / antitoxin HigA